MASVETQILPLEERRLIVIMKVAVSIKPLLPHSSPFAEQMYMFSTCANTNLAHKLPVWGFVLSQSFIQTFFTSLLGVISSFIVQDRWLFESFFFIFSVIFPFSRFMCVLAYLQVDLCVRMSVCHTNVKTAINSLLRHFSAII